MQSVTEQRKVRAAKKLQRNVSSGWFRGVGAGLMCLGFYGASTGYRDLSMLGLMLGVVFLLYAKEMYLEADQALREYLIKRDKDE